MKMAHRRLFFLMVLFGAAAASNDDWTQKCNKCKCVWSNGKRTADCTSKSLSEIPKDLSSEIREIDFSNNPLHYLGKEVVIRAELRDIHKLKFVNCSISDLDDTAFKGLLLLIELDLSSNSISTLTSKTFKDNLKLRILSLSHNKIQRLESGLFYNLTHLQKVSLDHNEIEYINDTAFVLLPALQNLNLADNKLTVMDADFLNHFPKLISLNLEGNPWVCDCHLQEFRNKTRKENLITTRTTCDQPPLLRGRSWTDDVVFACVPQIIEPQPSTHIEATTSNVTLTCRVLGDPQPDVNWVWGSNGKIIEKDPRQNTQRFITSKRKVGDYTWNNLTITNVNYRDKGEYKCIATNPGGVDEKNVSLTVSTLGGLGGGGSLGFSATLPLIIALSVGAVVILIIIVVLMCCCCKRNTHGMSSKRRDLQNSSDECIRLHHGQAEMEKALITDVNPVMKPPRVCSVPPSVNSGGTEVSEVKKNLLDSDSMFAGDDESHSFDFDMHPYRKSSALLDPDYRGNHPYPPDLLPFPPRMCQVSPAGSSASTVADTSRLPAHHGPQSPLHSPLYDSVYRTLPYSRSQSPFVGPPPARVPRQGYVTIPRRPKQRWSTETPAASDVEEPMYDNLGLRTTADGSSMLSLNKAGEATTPKSARLFPLSPSCDPIAEHESLPMASTLPREGAKLSPSRTQWAKDNADALRSPDNRRNSMPDGKVKVAPVPPPKPKKRTSTGPLFEDEGEDGTEV